MGESLPKRSKLSPILLVVGVTAAAMADAPIQFVDVSTARGIHPYQMAYGLGGSVVAADFDDDGDVDLFVPNEQGWADQLYLNLGAGLFEEVATAAGVASLGRSRVALWFDYDGDSLLDLFVVGDCWSEDTDCSTEPTFRLYRQLAGTQFQDVTSSAELPDSRVDTTSQAGGLAAGDINDDGYLDLVIGLWETGPTRLLLNDGDGTFTEITAASGLGSAADVANHQSILHDFDGDGRLDIFNAIDYEPNNLWINRGGNTFTDEAATAGVDTAMNEMGVALGDHENDGDLDLYVTNIAAGSLHSVFFRNDTVGSTLQFTEVAQELGVDQGFWGWGTTFLDADNDGWLDLAATNGYSVPPFSTDPSRFFLNQGGDPVTFVDMSDASGFNDTLWGSALVAADLDRDGDLDLVQSCNGNGLAGSLRVLDNQQGAAAMANNYLVVKPRMSGTNHRAIGAVVRIEVVGTQMMRLITAGTSFLGQEPAEAFFGIGGATIVDRVTVEWPVGGQTELTGVAVNQVLTVTVDTDSDNDGTPDVSDGDDDADGHPDETDCRPRGAQFWRAPGPVEDLALSQAGGITTFAWSPPPSPGGTVLYYDTLSATTPSDFVSSGSCLETNAGDRSSTDTELPSPGSVLYFLVRVENPCGETAGSDSAANPRTALVCR
jgi:hypothetical protein